MLDLPGLPRGIPAASLKLDYRASSIVSNAPIRSSAGNTRGLIEAVVPGKLPRGSDRIQASLPRGIPAASLKRNTRDRPPRRLTMV